MILILDIGKTNKKCFVFDADYRIVLERSSTILETTDEDGEPCEDLDSLSSWTLDTVREILNDPRFQIRAINVSAYGASLVHLDASGRPLTPLYNYLRPFPQALKIQFFETYGGEAKISLETASPVLGNLNAGLQLYWLKQQQPLHFKQIKWSLHLPQYLAFLIRQQSGGDSKSPPDYAASEITSIGCHTLLWDFRKNDYHDWVQAEGITAKLPTIQFGSATTAITSQPFNLPVGFGLHDSSAALIPYLACYDEPFVLISTGTWCISLNPFNREPLTIAELEQDCLCYLTYTGQPVKAARYFAGQAHEQKVQELARTFGVEAEFYKTDQHIANPKLAEIYLDFMGQLVDNQVISTKLAIGNSPVRRLFVDGGFSKNDLYLQLLAAAFPEMEVYAAEVPQATALGAAMAIHTAWNDQLLPQNLISLKKYAATKLCD